MIPAIEIAANRFGLGARPGDLEAARANPKGWLIQQLEPLNLAQDLSESQEALAKLKVFRALKEKGQKASEASMASMNSMVSDPENQVKSEKKMRRSISRDAIALATQTLVQQIRSENGLQSRLLDFFSNHFSVSMTNLPMRALAPTLEREAIAPHLVGHFESMLIAVEQHPAMLFYLNNEQSIGPDSRVGKRRQQRGLNENLAREILELHTLGVDGGYTQTDVRELAMAITGWSVVNKDNKRGFLFRQVTHQPGTRTLLTQDFPQQGQAQGMAMLQMLARHPSTARHISFKLARHFIADQPPQVLVEAMTKTWLASGGDLKQVMLAMIEHPESWQMQQQKLKTPREFLISALRTGATPMPKAKALEDSLEALGQLPFSAGSPAGYGDTTGTWDGAEALIRRAEWSYQLAGQLLESKKSRVPELASEILGGQLRQDTLSLLQRTPNPRQAFALLLMSPEFQRR